MKGRFKLGQLLITPNCQEKVAHTEIAFCLLRHVQGNWGDLSEEDKQYNELALQTGERIISSYKSSEGTKFWIITEADRSSTTVLLPEDY